MVLFSLSLIAAELWGLSLQIFLVISYRVFILPLSAAFWGPSLRSSSHFLLSAMMFQIWLLCLSPYISLVAVVVFTMSLNVSSPRSLPMTLRWSTACCMFLFLRPSTFSAVLLYALLNWFHLVLMSGSSSMASRTANDCCVPIWKHS